MNNDRCIWAILLTQIWQTSGISLKFGKKENSQIFHSFSEISRLKQILGFWQVCTVGPIWSSMEFSVTIYKIH